MSTTGTSRFEAADGKIITFVGETYDHAFVGGKRIAYSEIAFPLSIAEPEPVIESPQSLHITFTRDTLVYQLRNKLFSGLSWGFIADPWGFIVELFSPGIWVDVIDSGEYMIYKITLFDPATEITGTIDFEWDIRDPEWQDNGVRYMWEEGNYGCDCNRSNYLYPNGEHDYDCGDTIVLLKIVNPSGEEVDLHDTPVDQAIKALKRIRVLESSGRLDCEEAIRLRSCGMAYWSVMDAEDRDRVTTLARVLKVEPLDLRKTEPVAI